MARMDMNIEKPGFEIVFFYMGQGDCILIKCPDGKVIVVDCGSAALFFPEYQKNMPDTIKACLQGAPVHALILTHPDRDHYNKVLNFFNSISSIYFSGELRQYNQNGLSQVINTDPTVNVYKVTINSAEKKLEKRILTQKEYKYVPVSSDCVVAAGNGWSVSIIAGGVEGKSTTNAGSLVTLLDCNGKKALLTGDATTETMDFLLASYPQILNTVELVQMPHHGSEECLPPARFAQLCDPCFLVASVGYMEHVFCLPRYNAINRWCDGKRYKENKQSNLCFDSWCEDENGKGEAMKEAAIEDQNKFIITNSRSTYFQVEQPQANYYWGAHEEQNRFLLYYRDGPNYKNDPIFITAALGILQFELSGKGAKFLKSTVYSGDTTEIFSNDSYTSDDETEKKDL